MFTTYLGYRLERSGASINIMDGSGYLLARVRKWDDAVRWVEGDNQKEKTDAPTRTALADPSARRA